MWDRFWWGSVETSSRPDTLQHLPPVIWKKGQNLQVTTGLSGCLGVLMIPGHEDDEEAEVIQTKCSSMQLEKQFVQGARKTAVPAVYGPVG